MIQSFMLAAMGFLAASLLALVIAPAFWSRAVRLTSQRLRSSLPLSEAEIRADKDLLRAEYALKVHQLEREVEQGRLGAHRQQIEINRRDIELGRVGALLDERESALDEHVNARAVLEQTVRERIPALERALEDARGVLDAREDAIRQLQATSERQTSELADGQAIMTQRSLEVQRLQALLKEADAHGRDRRVDGAAESNLALRAEIESLRARLAERTAIADRLQSEAQVRLTSTPAAQASELDDEGAELRAKLQRQSAEVRQLRRELTGAPLPTPTEATVGIAPEMAQRLLDLEAKVKEQSDEIARLSAENDAVAKAGDAAGNAAVKQSKLWLKARNERLEGDLDRERETVGKLRAELAATNERLARQASALRDELRRQGARTLVPASMALRTGPAPSTTARKTQEAAGVATQAGEPPRPTGVTTARRAVSARARELQRALQGHFKVESDRGEPAADGLPPSAPVVAVVAPPVPTEAAAVDPAQTAGAPASEALPSAAQQSATGPRNRLLDRLKSYEQA